MAEQAILVVVVVRDSGLRSALAAHLSLEGYDLLTASSIGYGLLGSAMIRHPSVLVIDEALIPLDPERWIEKQRNAGEWARLAVVADTRAVGDEWCLRITPRSARKALTGMLDSCSEALSLDR